MSRKALFIFVSIEDRKVEFHILIKYISQPISNGLLSAAVSPVASVRASLRGPRKKEGCVLPYLSSNRRLEIVIASTPSEASMGNMDASLVDKTPVDFR